MNAIWPSVVWYSRMFVDWVGTGWCAHAHRRPRGCRPLLWHVGSWSVRLCFGMHSVVLHAYRCCLPRRMFVGHRIALLVVLGLGQSRLWCLASAGGGAELAACVASVWLKPRRLREAGTAWGPWRGVSLGMNCMIERMSSRLVSQEAAGVMSSIRELQMLVVLLSRCVMMGI